MSKTRHGRSYWLDNFPNSRIPSYPRHRGVTPTEVVIIGGGLTGCASAYAFASAGAKVILLEADQIGRGTTALSSGWLSQDPGVPFGDLEKAIGLRFARHAWQAWRRAALDFAALLRRLEIKCYLEERGSVTVALTPEQMVRLKRDQKSRREAGVDAPMLTARTIKAEFGLDGMAGLRSKEGATIDPYRACVGLAAAAVERGAQLFERSPVRKITFGRKTADVFTAGGSMRVKRIIVATGVPTVSLFKSLRRHFWFHTTYLALTEAVPAKIRQQLGKRASIVRDSAHPPHIVRWVNDERLMVTGADSETCPPRQQDKVLVQKTGQLMYELSTLYPDISGIQPEYGWSADYARTAEGLPYIGAHRNFPHHLFAFGDSSHSVTGAYLASRILLREHFDEMDRGDAAFGFHR
jgi:glycine/D-amino acid oxidase-like deaminating enzyme